VPAFFDHFPPSSFDFAERSLERRPARIDHDIPARGDFFAMQTKRFTNPAFDAVADDGSTQRARDGEAEARSR
jgi:hypothetical protein